MVAAAGYHGTEFGIFFRQRHVLTDGICAADFLRAGGCRVAIVESSQERAFALRGDAIGLRYGRGYPERPAAEKLGLRLLRSVDV